MEEHKHDYYLIKDIIVAHPHDVLYGSNVPDIHIRLGRDSMKQVCTTCYDIKGLNDPRL